MKKPVHVALLLTVAAAAVLMLGAIAGCGKSGSLVTGPDDSASSLAGLHATTAELHSAMRIQESHTPELLRMPGVVGTAVTADATGRPAVLILTESAMGPGRLPLQLDGLNVIEQVTGKIHAYRGHGGTSHTAKQTPPIQLGTSGGNVNDISNGFCCSGTLGSLVQKGGTQYILSNSHVFAGDVVSGGNGRVSQIGDDVNQPGLVDNNCSTSNTNIVADVSSLSTLFGSGSANVDCAIAQVRSGMVSSTGSILEVGTLSASTVAASVGQAVKKSGRTTGLTRSSISGLNATITVGYEDECGGNQLTKQFTGQILVTNTASRFLNSGDSGSLMVEDVSTNPRAVGLLFAGSSSIAVANPIGAVLSHLGATMVGN
jgi:predicted small lipoprotein YifL